MIYFDNAATSFPKPKEVIDAVSECMTSYAANPGRSGHKMSLMMDRKIFEAREEITDFIGGDDPLKLIFTSNATEALNIAIRGSIHEESHVVTTSLEHNSVLRPLTHLKNDKNIKVDIVYGDKNSYLSANKIMEKVTKDTRAVVVTHISNLTGSVVDIEELGQRIKDLNPNILFIVDASQSIGLFDVDVKRMNIDLLCFPGHKSLLGPMGTGACYINTDIELDCYREGGTGSFSKQLTQPNVYPDKFEAGTLNGPGIVGLMEGVRYIKKVGRENIKKHELSLRKRFIEGIKDLDFVTVYGPIDEHYSNVLAMNINGVDSSLVSYRLSEEFDIATRPGIHCAPLCHETINTSDIGLVRFSFGYSNTEEEVDKAISAIKAIGESECKD